MQILCDKLAVPTFTTMNTYRAELFFIKLCCVLFIVTCLFAIYNYRQLHAMSVGNNSLNHADNYSIVYEKP
jgi:hypothetical protein